MSSLALETIGYRAPLALRCIDVVTGAEVSYGLQATAWRPQDRAGLRTARGSAVSALLTFTTLPGMRRQEYAAAAGDGPVVFPAGSPATFVVRVVDISGAYLPQVFEVVVPQVAPVTVLLYSAPGRGHPAGLAAVYGDMEVHPGTSPAAWALVDVGQGGASWTAMCDERGCFLLYLPYPEVLPALSGNPPQGGGMGDVTWPLTISARYEPAGLTWPVDPGPAGPPDRISIEAQSAAQLADGGTQQSSVTATLTYGMPLLLRLSVVP
jgi:hypothetical protein